MKELQEIWDESILERIKDLTNPEDPNLNVSPNQNNEEQKEEPKKEAIKIGNFNQTKKERETCFQ